MHMALPYITMCLDCYVVLLVALVEMPVPAGIFFLTGLLVFVVSQVAASVERTTLKATPGSCV